MRKVKILHVVGTLIRGGVQAWLSQIVRKLDQDRFEHHVVVWTTQDETYSAEYRDAGVTIHGFDNYRNPWLLGRWLKWLVGSIGPFDILHTHQTYMNGYLMLLAKQAGIRKCLAHSHIDVRSNLHGRKLPYRMYAEGGHRAIRLLSSAGLAVSDDAAASMFGVNWTADPRWQILMCGINLEPFVAPPDHNLRRALGIPEGRRVIGHVGRFEEQKNHEFLLEVASELNRRGENVHFLLVGEGSLRIAFVNKVEQRRLSDRFTILRDSSSVPQQMTNAMDLFLFPSRYEGLPIVVIEAQAAGLPCLLSTEIPKEAAIEPSLICTLNLSAGAGAWADATMGLPGRIDPFNATLRRRFEQSKFNIQSSAASLVSVYESVLADGQLCRGS